MRSLKSTIAVVTLFAAVAFFALALLAPVSAAPEPSIASLGQGPTVDAHAPASVSLDARTATSVASRHDSPYPSGPFADADRPLRQVVAIEAMASAIRVPRPGPGALLIPADWEQAVRAALDEAGATYDFFPIWREP